MKIILSHGYFLAEDPKEQVIMKPYPPLGILYIASYLKANRLACSVFDTTFSTVEKLFRHLEAEQPDVLALYTNLMTKLNVLKIIRFVKQSPLLRHTRIVLGGPEVTHNVAKFLSHGADFVVIGEGEETMLALVQALKHPQNLPLGEVAGIAFTGADGCPVFTPEREKRKDLDTLPMPDREAIDLSLYLQVWKERHGTNAISVSTMRGCPYTCKWCSRAVYGLSYRRRSPEKVVEELVWIKNKYQPDSLWFVDDVFTISHKWMQGFADACRKADLNIPYECISRADRLNNEVINLLKETGCFRVWIGAESGSQRVIDAMDRRVSVQKTREMIKVVRKTGMQAGTFIMLGYPGETEADIEETISHLKESAPDFYTITLAYPIKGTEMYNEIEPSLYPVSDWEKSTDRDLVYRRTYSPRFYHFALKRVSNEVQFGKMMQQPGASVVELLGHKAKSEVAKMLMAWERLKSM